MNSKNLCYISKQANDELTQKMLPETDEYYKLFCGHIAKVVKRTLKKDIFCHIHYYMLIQWVFTNSSFTTKGKYASFIIVKNTTLCAHNYDYDGLYTHYFNNNFEKKKQISVQLMSVY